MTKRTMALFLVLIACAARPLVAGVGGFTSIGPGGALTSALVIDPSKPSTIYAGTRGGIFKSLDGGETWTLSVDPITLPGESALDRVVGPMAIDPLHPATLYAGTQTGEVMKTRDGGATWVVLDALHQTKAILRLVIDPVNPETLYALTYADLLQTTDGGTSWNSRVVGKVTALAIDPSHSSRLYSGTDSGLFVSNDRGQQWSLLLGGVDGMVSRVAVDPNDSASVYAAGYSAGRPVLASTNDLGKTWKTIPFENPRDIVVDPISSAAYALNGMVIRNGTEDPSEILVTLDRGLNWKALPKVLRDADFLAVDPTREGRLYAASRGDLLKTTDAGTSWRSIHEGIAAAYVSNVIVDPSQPSTLFAAAYQGVVKSFDGGAHWSAVQLDLGNVKLAADPQRSSTLFAYNYSTTVRSADGGESWVKIHPGDHVTGMAVDPSDSAIVYAVLANGLAKSSDGGSGWTSIGIGQLPLGYYGFDGGAIAVDPMVPTNVYAAGSGGIVKSTDAGTSWKTVFVDPAGADSYGPYFSSLAIDPRVPSTLYALAFTKVFKSDNAGQDWRVIFTNPPKGSYFVSLAIDPLQTSDLYLATSYGLFRSKDRGEQWAEFNEGLPTRFPNSVTVDTVGNVYAATARGLFVNSVRTDLLHEASAISVSLRTHAGNFVSAKNCGSSTVDANARLAERCETFTLFDLNAGQLNDGDSISLRAANGAFVVAEGGGTAGSQSAVLANRGLPAAWETFVIHRLGGVGRINAGDAISLQSAGGGYVAAEGGGADGCRCDSRLNADRPLAREWETFVILMH